MSDPVPTPDIPIPEKIAQSIAARINSSLNPPVQAISCFTTITNSTSESLTVQPLASKRWKVARGCWNEDTVIQVRYHSDTEDNATSNLTFFNQLDEWQGLEFDIQGVTGHFVISEFIYNSPIDLNKYTVAEGFFDTDALENDQVAMIAGYFTVKRVWYG